MCIVQRYTQRENLIWFVAPKRKNGTFQGKSATRNMVKYCYLPMRMYIGKWSLTPAVYSTPSYAESGRPRLSNNARCR